MAIWQYDIGAGSAGRVIGAVLKSPGNPPPLAVQFTFDTAQVEGRTAVLQALEELKIFISSDVYPPA